MLDENGYKLVRTPGGVYRIYGELYVRWDGI
jgi:hypothetical protein